MQSTRVWSRCRMHLEELRGKHITCLKLIYLTLGHCSLWVLCELCGSWFCRVVHIPTLFIAMLSYMGCWTYWLLFLANCMGHEKSRCTAGKFKNEHALEPLRTLHPQVWPSFNTRTYPQYVFSAFVMIRTRIYLLESFFVRCLLHRYICGVTWLLGQTFMLENWKYWSFTLSMGKTTNPGVYGAWSRALCRQFE